MAISNYILCYIFSDMQISASLPMYNLTQPTLVCFLSTLRTTIRSSQKIPSSKFQNSRLTSLKNKQLIAKILFNGFRLTFPTLSTQVFHQHIFFSCQRFAIFSDSFPFLLCKCFQRWKVNSNYLFLYCFHSFDVRCHL